MEHTTTVLLLDPVDEGGEGREPGEAEEEVERVVQEVLGEREHPDKREESGDGGDDFCVDFAADGTDMAVVPVLVDEVADDA
jgi:hypothetical protein